MLNCIILGCAFVKYKTKITSIKTPELGLIGFCQCIELNGSLVELELELKN